jgi:glycosyltransferase involved in cell wall biosynthesis
MKIIATCPIYNEVKNGNLERYLKNVSKLCDDIIILDDCSTDAPEELVYKYTNNLYSTQENNYVKRLETLNKGFLLSKAREMGGDWILVLDADEIMEKRFTRETMEWEIKDAEKKNIVSLGFIWTNLWMSSYYYRTDKGLGQISPPRLYKILDDDIRVVEQMHQAVWPVSANDPRILAYRLLHYSSVHVDSLVDKIVNYILLDTRYEFERIKNSYLNELFQGVVVEKVDLEWFAEENIPEKKDVNFEEIYNLIRTKANDLLLRKMNG